jgi:tRNA(Glu) U13 pseudouridine synthase TruD
VKEPAVREADDGLEVQFALPAGAYATAVMRELMKSE